MTIVLIAAAITWRNLTHERLTLDIGLQRSQMETLEKEIEHLTGQVETEASYTRLWKWARVERGWSALPGRARTLTVSDSLLTSAGREEARILGIFSDE